MKILSIQVGKTKIVEFQGSQVTTGIYKSPVSGPILLKTLGLEGDGQADLRVHGGRDKALYAYSYDTYPDWKTLRPQDEFFYGAFGENICFEFLKEDTLCVGDIFELGAAVIQVTQPRFPCQKLVVKFNDPKILKQFMKFGRPGIYFRVLQEGIIQVVKELKLISQESEKKSIKDLFNLKIN